MLFSCQQSNFTIVNCRGVLREVYRLFVGDEGSHLGYDEWADALEEGLSRSE